MEKPGEPFGAPRSPDGRAASEALPLHWLKTTFKKSHPPQPLWTKTDMALPQNGNPGLFSWGRYPIPSGAPLQFRVGPLTVFVKKEGDEVWVTHHSTGVGKPPPSGSDPGLTWDRWGASESPDEIEVLPTFPDRPLVLHPESPFNLLPGARARIYVRVPLWVRVLVPGQQGGC